MTTAAKTNAGSLLVDRDIDLVFIGEDLLLHGGGCEPQIFAAAHPAAVTMKSSTREKNVTCTRRKRLPVRNVEDSSEDEIVNPVRKRSRIVTCKAKRSTVRSRSKRNTNSKIGSTGSPPCTSESESSSSESECPPSDSDSDCDTPCQSTSDEDSSPTHSRNRETVVPHASLRAGVIRTAESSDESSDVDESDEASNTDSDSESEDLQCTLPISSRGPFDPYLFIKNLPPHESLIQQPIVLPPQSPSLPRPTLVLDLDETLVHCSLESIPGEDLVFDVTICGKEYQMHARRRPHLEQFLLAVSALFEVVVFTASQSEYASKLLNHLDPKNCLFTYRIYREGCVAVEGNYLKDLTVLGRDLSRVVIVDNSPHVFGYQMDNGVPILSFIDSNEDNELLKLLPLLTTLSSAQDVRPILRETYGTHKRVELSNP
ncbi:nuclear lim interactor-interacting protein [Pelomyxa schiedti]|nr:nuclear lim interactor-interacting protein [Pelomyxa schiedti]